MKKERPLIFISNDDGVTAKGINELITYLRPLADIIVMAPDSPRSGSASALTVVEPIHYQLVHQEEGITIYKCSGTPADCVKLAFNTVLNRKPDVVIGGINHGDNSSVNVHYSGTMGVVIEGCLKGIPSIGFSLCNHDANADFEFASSYIREITDRVIKKGLPAMTCLNVNIPDVKEPKGIKVCIQTQGEWVNEWEIISRRNGRDYYWLTGNFENSDKTNEQNDHWALDNGYIAITPVRVDVTAYDFVEELNAWF